MNKELLSYACILAAKQGCYEAMKQILQYYQPYIAEVSRRRVFDSYGNDYYFADTELCKRIETKMIYSIIYNFDPYHLPQNKE